MTKYLQDIYSQPTNLIRSLEYSLDAGKNQLRRAAVLIKQARYIYIVGIGASWSAGISLRTSFSSIGMLSSLCDASEFLHFEQIPDNSVVIFLSRSGKSIEIIESLPKCKMVKASIIAITNDPNAMLAKSADCCLFTNVDFDHSISVNTYTSIVLIGQILISFIDHSAMVKEDLILLNKAIHNLNLEIPRYYEMLFGNNWIDPDGYFYFIARNQNLASAHESMLLWEEGAKKSASAMSTGSFRHGPQEIVGPELHLAIWLENGETRKYDVDLINDLHDQGVNTLTIGNSLPVSLKGHLINMPPAPELFNPVFNIIPMQIAADPLASARGENPDAFKFCNFIVENEGGL